MMGLIAKALAACLVPQAFFGASAALDKRAPADVPSYVLDYGKC